MAKPFKIFLIIVGSFIALIVGIAIAVPLFFDPNDYKGQITVAAKDNTGRELTIGGDIDLSLFPWLGVSLSDVTLGNAEGFGPEPFAHLKDMDVRVRLLPLIADQKIVIGKVSIHGLALNLAKDKDGRSNWDDLAKSKDEEEPEAPPEKPQPESPFSLTVGGLDISDMSVSYDDRQAGAAYKVDQFALKTGPVTLEDPVELTLSFLASAPDVSAEVKLALTAVHDLDAKVFEARDLKLDVGVQGKSIPGGKQEMGFRSNIRFDQKADTLAVNDGVIEAAGMTVNATIQGAGMTGDAPKLTGKFSSNTFNARELAQKFGAALPPAQDPNALSQVSFSSDYSGSLKSARLDNLRIKLDQSTASGHVHVTDFATQNIEFALKVDAIDADRYLAPAAAEADTKEGGGDFRKTELPIAALDQVNAKGRIEIGALTLKKAKLSDVVIELDAPKGKVKTQEMKAKLYGGTLAQAARITPGPKPTYTMTAGLDSINAAPLLQDFAGKAYLSGIGDFKLNIASGGTTVGDALRGLNGTVSSAFIKGAIEGFNLKYKINQAKALYRNEAAPAEAAPRTEFTDVKGAGKITNGVLKTETLKATGTDYNLTGDGNIDLAGLAIDYVLKPTYTGGGQDLKDLGGVTIPVKITGSLLKPDVKVDLAGVLKDKVKTEVKGAVKKEETKLKEKAAKKLTDFFNKPKAEPKPAPAPAPSDSKSTETAPAQPAPATTDKPAESPPPSQ